jgi:amidohydrolase
MNEKIQKIIVERSNDLFEKVKEYREHLHQFPELSYQEYNTMNFVSETLKKIGVRHEGGIGGTGVVALISNSSHAPSQSCVALRADLDALPIQEENEVEYKSTIKGVMHACGHDVHTAILLGVAEILQELRNELDHPVKLIFQPGEEKNPGGATLMIRDGVLKNPTVKKMFALHVFPDMKSGKVGFKEGIYMASCDEIYVNIQGKGGHGATPHTTIDPIMIGATLITSLQQIVSRKCDPTIPCVLSFGHFEGIGATNIIPSHVLLKGTFRTLDEKWRKEAWKLIREQIEAIAFSQGGTAKVEISQGYPYLKNDPEITAHLRTKAENMLGSDKVEQLPIRMTSEDFSFYAQEVPVCFFRLGVRNDEKGIIYGVHHPQFDIDPISLKTGMQILSIAAF